MPLASRPDSHSVQRKSAKRKPATSNTLEILRAPSLADVPWLIHGFSTRPGGVSSCYGGLSLNLGVTPADTRENVARNRELLLEALGATNEDSGSMWPLVQVKQIHSALVYPINALPQDPLAGDGVITDTSELVLAVKTADCVPVLLADLKRRVVGAFHAGWRGTVARIVEKGVGEMRRQFGSQPRNLRAAIGPSIRRCCYQVGPEVRAEFDSQFPYSSELFEEVFDANAIHVRYPMLFLTARAPGHSELGPELHLDLVEANRRQLADAGLRNKNISVVDGCTACETTRFFSHRAQFGNTGRMMAVIGIRSK
ncbi:MAG: peptidoglycan editing factor PgeF [Candidatus Korobacteraceae bacterium]